MKDQGWRLEVGGYKDKIDFVYKNCLFLYKHMINYETGFCHARSEEKMVKEEEEDALQRAYEARMERERVLSLAAHKELFAAHLLGSGDLVIQCVMDRFKYFQDIFEMFDLYTTRFNSFTYLQNQRCKAGMDWSGGSSSMREGAAVVGSLYSTTMPLPASAPRDKYLFVLDMNNTTNRLMGVGLIKNVLAKDQNVRVYDDPGFNNYIYKSRFYVPLVDAGAGAGGSVDAGGFWDNGIMAFVANELEDNLFYGKAHLKRGGSFTAFPRKKLKFKHLRFLLTLFAAYNPNGFGKVVLGVG